MSVGTLRGADGDLGSYLRVLTLVLFDNLYQFFDLYLFYHELFYDYFLFQDQDAFFLERGGKLYIPGVFNVFDSYSINTRGSHATSVRRQRFYGTLFVFVGFYKGLLDLLVVHGVNGDRVKVGVRGT